MHLTQADRERLVAQRIIDFTTYRRSSGQPHRVEIWWFEVANRLVITGSPGRRDWLANVRENPRVVIHGSGIDVEATASVVEDPVFRRQVFTQPETSWYTTQAELDRLVETSPMIEIHLPAEPALSTS